MYTATTTAGTSRGPIFITKAQAIRLRDEHLANARKTRNGDDKDYELIRASQYERMIDRGEVAPEPAPAKRTGLGIEHSGEPQRFWVYDYDSGKTIAGPFDFFSDANDKLIEIQLGGGK